jgi:diguanylate cyclase (GGDEF)-like protein
VETLNGKIWIGTTSGLFSIQEHRAVRADEPGVVGRVHALVANGKGELIASIGNRILRIAASGEIVELSVGLSDQPIGVLATSRSGEIWAGSNGDGLFRIKDGETTIFGRAEGLTCERVRALLVDPEGFIWIGTEGGGLNRLSAGRVEALTSQHGLPSDLVRAIARDHEGTVWIGTNGGGLVALKHSKVVRYTTKRGLSSDSVRTIAQMSDGSIWLGTDGGGVNTIRGDEIVALGESEGLSGAFVRSLYEASDGTIWMGSANSGLFSIRDNNLVRFKGLLPSESITSVDESDDHTLWVGTSRGVVSVQRDRVRVFGTNEGLGDANVQVVSVDSRGQVWVGTVSGVFVISGETVTAFSLEAEQPTSTFCIRHDPDGTVWIGSSDGLRLLREGALYHFDHASGVPNFAIFQILEDQLGYFWLTSNRGIFRVLRSDLEDFAGRGVGTITVEHFGQSDGMHTDQANGGTQPAGWVASDGRVWIPTPFGAAVIDPQEMNRNSIPPPVTIEKIEIDGILNPIGSDMIVLEPGFHDIEVDYAAMSFLDPASVQFEYQLEGLRPRWVEAGGRRRALFANVGAGSYRFQVIAANNDGVWNQHGAAFELKIEPYIWQKRYIQILAAILLLVAIRAFIWLRVRAIQAKRRRLAQLVKERTAQLAVVSDELYNLSISDPLTGVANRRRFDEVFTRDWKRAIRSRAPLSLFLIDVDYFKAYNDSFGHQQGDECLKAIATVLDGAMKRESDLVSRYGGEEFAVILPSTPKESALALAESLRQKVEERSLPSTSDRVVTISIGVATKTPTLHDSMDLLLTAADRALYKAKDEGRNRVVISEEISARILRGVSSPRL